MKTITCTLRVHRERLAAKHQHVLKRARSRTTLRAFSRRDLNFTGCLAAPNFCERAAK